MEKLVRGLHEFQSNYFSTKRELFERLGHGQNPETLFITCSDSRINPNLLTQTKPGELFILRNAGNIVPPYGAGNGGEACTIEYAVAALGVKDIIVCGHSHCGAMHGLLHPDALEDLPATTSWLKHADATKRIMRENYAELPEDKQLMACIEENVLVQIENLRTHPTVAARLAKGTLHLHAWVYKFVTGEVFNYDPEQGQFIDLTPPTDGAAISVPQLTPGAKRLPVV